ncbi:MAG TPA: CHAD domain-containing protein [Candidatus Angelobacter sp.]|nr:CHAD domain-containing protein [Candidatus Angelobacter sp.]
MSLLSKKAKGFLEAFKDAFSKLQVEISPEHVHHLRTAIRRIETLLSYAGHISGKKQKLSKKQKKMLEELASLRKRAGRVRDIDIQLRLLNGLANGSAAADRHKLAHRMTFRRESLVGRLLDSLKKLEKEKLLPHLERAVEEIRSNGDGDREKIQSPLIAAKSSLEEIADRFSGRQLKPRHLHALRIQLKGVRYLAELDADSHDRQSLLEAARAVQDALGEWHDWDTLLRTAEKQFEDRVNCPLLVEIRSLLAAKQIAATMAAAGLLASSEQSTGRQEAQIGPAPILALRV